MNTTKKAWAAALAAVALLIPAAPAHAAGEMTVVGHDVLVPFAGQCSIQTTDWGVKFDEVTDWSARIIITAPSGEVHRSLDFSPMRSQESSYTTEQIVCPEEEGTYTVTGYLLSESPYVPTYMRGSVSPSWSDTFAVKFETKTAAVTGSVKAKRLGRGLRLKFSSDRLPANTVSGRDLAWRVVVDGKTKRFRMGADEGRTLTYRWKTGKHTVKVFKSGRLVVKRTVRVS